MTVEDVKRVILEAAQEGPFVFYYHGYARGFQSAEEAAHVVRQYHGSLIIVREGGR